MKRDMNLIRSILIAAESDDLKVERIMRSGDVYREHVRLAEESGLTVCNGYSIRLTASGADFLDDVRDESVWREAMEIRDRAGGCGFDVLKMIVVKVKADRIVKPV